MKDNGFKTDFEQAGVKQRDIRKVEYILEDFSAGMYDEDELKNSYFHGFPKDKKATYLRLLKLAFKVYEIRKQRRQVMKDELFAKLEADHYDKLIKSKLQRIAELEEIKQIAIDKLGSGSITETISNRRNFKVKRFSRDLTPGEIRDLTQTIVSIDAEISKMLGAYAPKEVHNKNEQIGALAEGVTIVNSEGKTVVKM